jgi:drug/metabolite transporter (DMT)-like permease
MDPSSFSRLLLLSAIWGGSFLFMRIGVPVLGPALLIFFRVGLASVFLLSIGLLYRQRLFVSLHWRHYLILGLFNSALPFFCFAYAAQTISASLLSILNATAPIWATVISAMWLKTQLTLKSILGMTLGLIGVGVLAGVEALYLPENGHIAIIAGLGAALSYGIATIYAKSAVQIAPFANAHGSLWGATFLLAPFAWISFPLSNQPQLQVILAVTALGVACSGIAYLIYFRLISDLGATSALTVTFLVPFFGILWGWLFLDESIGSHTIIGGAVVLVGTALVTNFSVKDLFVQKKAAPPRLPRAQ